MKSFIRITFAAFIILFALSGLFTAAGFVTGIALHGTFREGSEELTSELDGAMKHFSDHFESFAVTRNGLVFSDSKNSLIKYRDQQWTFYPVNRGRLMIHAYKADVHITESDTDVITVTVKGNINHHVRMSRETLSIDPVESFFGVGPRSEVSVEIPKGLSFASVSLYADHGNIEADTLISVNANAVADRGSISITNALVADQELTADIRYGSLYANCIRTSRLGLQATASSVNAGLTDDISRLHTTLYASDLSLKLPASVKSKAMDIKMDDKRFSRYNITYE